MGEQRAADVFVLGEEIAMKNEKKSIKSCSGFAASGCSTEKVLGEIKKKKKNRANAEGLTKP